MSRLNWLDLFQDPIDVVGFILFLLVFPVYHGLYPKLMVLFPNRASKTRFDLFRRSWIQRVIDRGDTILAAQQTRNLTMVNTLLASSALILMGVTANVLLQLPSFQSDLPPPLATHPGALATRLLLLLMVFGVAFAYCMTALRHLGHFNLVVGADPNVIAEHEGSAVEYLSALINRASNRYTLAVRCLYSASPLFLWLFDNRLFLLLTLFWAIKFLGFQDFMPRGPGASTGRSPESA